MKKLYLCAVLLFLFLSSRAEAQNHYVGSLAWQFDPFKADYSGLQVNVRLGKYLGGFYHYNPDYSLVRDTKVYSDRSGAYQYSIDDKIQYFGLKLFVLDIVNTSKSSGQGDFASLYLGYAQGSQNQKIRVTEIRSETAGEIQTGTFDREVEFELSRVLMGVAVMSNTIYIETYLMYEFGKVPLDEDIRTAGTKEIEVGNFSVEFLFGLMSYYL